MQHRSLWYVTSDDHLGATVTTRNRLRATLALAVATLMAATVGCTSDGGDDLPPVAPARTNEPTQPAGPELTAAEQEAVDEAREVFDLFMAAYIDVATSDEVPDLDVHFRYTQYAGGPIVIELGNQIGENFLQDRTAQGSITWEFVEVVDVDLDRQFRERPSPELRLLYCIDESGWITVDKVTGEQYGEAGRRQLSTITARAQQDWGDTGRDGWRIIGRDDGRSQSC